MPTTVTFHQLAHADKDREVCRVVDAEFQEGKRVYVLVKDGAKAEEMNKLLWTFSQQSFIPHRIWQANEPFGFEQVLIGAVRQKPDGADVLVMADPAPVDFVAQFGEAVDFAETYRDTAKRSSRKRYADCKQAGFVMKYLRAEE